MLMESRQNHNRRRTQPQRSSRAAQAAEQRRADRRERARLEGLREKQKRRARRRATRRISSAAWKRLLIMAGIISAVVLSMLLFFRIGGGEEHISVVGNQYYTREEIVAASGLSKGDNLLTLSRAKVSGNILAKLRLISSVQVSRKLPNTVMITVSEFDVTYAVQDTQGDWYLMTSTGKVTDAVSAAEAAEYIQIQELTIAPPKVGGEIRVAVTESAAVSEAKETALLALLSQLEAAELTEKVVSVSVPNALDLSLWYGSQYRVELGDSADLDYKLEYLKEVVARLEDYRSGTIDLSFSEGSEARFTASDT